MKLLDAMNIVSNAADSKEAVIELLKAGCPKAILKTVVMDVYPISAKAIEEITKEWEAENKSTTRKAGGFAADFYNWLAEEARSEQEAHDYIMGLGEYGDTTKNTKAHLTHFLNIWALAETVRSGETVLRSFSAKKTTAGGSSSKAKAEPKQEKDTWEYDDSHPFQDVRSAKENLKRESQRARPRKTRVHPDKVAHLDDAELTKMYTDAFKAYFG